MPSTSVTFAISKELLRNLEKQIRWSFDPITNNWCHPRDPLTGAGCNWWIDPKSPPTLSVCMACPVYHMFCAGCQARPTCRIATRPKIRPDVRAFLTRFKVAREMHQSLWSGSYKELPVKEWAMIQKALNVVSECELELSKKYRKADS